MAIGKLGCSCHPLSNKVGKRVAHPTGSILGSLKTLQMCFQAAFILLARVKSKLPFNQNGAVVGLAPRQGGGLHVACLAVQHMVYVQPE